MFCFVILCNVCNKVLKKKKKVNGRENTFRLLKWSAVSPFAVEEVGVQVQIPARRPAVFFFFVFFFLSDRILPILTLLRGILGHSKQVRLLH